MAKPKGNKNFMVLSKADCVVAYKELFLNADSLYNDAKLLANNASYGRASSLLIHSTEERMKGLILFLDGNGFQFRNKVNGIDNLFDNHQLRYVVAMFISFLYIFSEDLKYFRNKVINDPSLIFELIENKEKTNDIFQQYAKQKIKIINHEINWFSNLEYLRQDGFYVDYVDEIKTPLHIDKTEFEEVLIRIDGMRNTISEIMQYFETNDDYLLKGILKMKKQLITENWYENLGILIKNIKDRKKDPLKDLSILLSGLLQEFERKN